MLPPSESDSDEYTDEEDGGRGEEGTGMPPQQPGG